MSKTLLQTMIYGLFLVGTSVATTPAFAERCTIAIMKLNENRLIVSVPKTIYTKEILLEEDQKRDPEEFLGFSNKCPQDDLLIFRVRDCTEGQIYDFAAIPNIDYSKEFDIPVYIIRGSGYDNFSGLDESHKCR